MNVDYAKTRETFRVPVDLASLRIWTRVRREIRAALNHRQTPLIVYQMGRVGSTALVTCLQEAGITRPILHTHFLSAQGVAFLYRLYLSRFGTWRNVPGNHKRHVLRSHAIGKYLDRNKKYQVMTLVRDPIATNLSGFFHNLEQSFIKCSSENTSKAGLTTELTNRFLAEYPHSVPLSWFDNELKQTFDLDIYDHLFPGDAGYLLCDAAKADVLVLKCERLNDCVSEACAKFLNVSNVRPTPTDRPLNSLSSSTYRDFIRDVQLPDSYLRKIYASKFATHFYSGDELQTFSCRWSSESDDKLPATAPQSPTGRLAENTAVPDVTRPADRDRGLARSS